MAKSPGLQPLPKSGYEGQEDLRLCEDLVFPEAKAPARPAGTQKPMKLLSGRRRALQVTTEKRISPASPGSPLPHLQSRPFQALLVSPDPIGL